MSIIRKTFGGIKRSFYIREFIFGFPIYAFILYTYFSKFNEFSKNATWLMVAFFVVFVTAKQLLYPYARFVYHSVTDYIIGRDTYIVNIFFLFIIRILMMAFCWSFSIILALFGLVYLYFYNRNR